MPYSQKACQEFNLAVWDMQLLYTISYYVSKFLVIVNADHQTAQFIAETEPPLNFSSVILVTLMYS